MEQEIWYKINQYVIQRFKVYSPSFSEDETNETCVVSNQEYFLYAAYLGNTLGLIN